MSERLTPEQRARALRAELEEVRRLWGEDTDRLADTRTALAAANTDKEEIVDAMAREHDEILNLRTALAAAQGALRELRACFTRNVCPLGKGPTAHGVTAGTVESMDDITIVSWETDWPAFLRVIGKVDAALAAESGKPGGEAQAGVFEAAALICERRASGHAEGSTAAIEARKCAGSIRSEYAQHAAMLALAPAPPEGHPAPALEAPPPDGFLTYSEAELRQMAARGECLGEHPGHEVCLGSCSLQAANEMAAPGAGEQRPRTEPGTYNVPAPTPEPKP